MYNSESSALLGGSRSVGEHLTVKFSGILQAEVDIRDLPEIAPPLFVYLDEKDLHITLLSSEIKECRKEFKKVWKERGKSLPPFPRVTYGEPYIADNGEKRSFVIDLSPKSQSDVAKWLAQALETLGIGSMVNHQGRVYHVSLANLTGSKFDHGSEP